MLYLVVGSLALNIGGMLAPTARAPPAITMAVSMEQGFGNYEQSKPMLSDFRGDTPGFYSDKATTGAAPGGSAVTSMEQKFGTYEQSKPMLSEFRGNTPGAYSGMVVPTQATPSAGRSMEQAFGCYEQSKAGARVNFQLNNVGC